MKWTGPTEVKPHGMRDGRRVPIKTLMRKLHVEQYDLPAPLHAGKIEPARLVLPLKQSAGTRVRGQGEGRRPRVRRPDHRRTRAQRAGRHPPRAVRRHSRRSVTGATASS